jgi:transposase-like protein
VFGFKEKAMRSEFSAEHFHSEEAAFAYVEMRMWPNGEPVCPHCGVIGKAGRLSGLRTKPSAKHPEGKPVVGLWKCYACRKQFTVRMRSIFESSHVPLHVWLQAIHLMASSKKGVSTNQLQRMLGGSMKTAWFLSHRIRECMKEVRGFAADPLGGIGMTLEADETWIGGKAENRAYGPVPPKQIVMALVERGGRVRSFHVPNVTAAVLRPILGVHAHRDSRFATDETVVYKGVGWNFRGGYGSVNHSAKEYVRGDIHTNTVEGYFSILKRGIYGVYQHVSGAHLHRYLSEFDFRYSYRIKTGYDDLARAERILTGAKGKRLTYQTTAGTWEPVPF